jgi:PPIC-type PPIASE domain
MTVTEQESRQYYDKHPQEFETPPTVTVRELLVAVAAPPEGRGGQPQFFAQQNTDQAARQKIDALRARAVAGEDFSKLVAEASESATKANGGLIGPINVSELASGIRSALERLQPGEITDPIRSTRGYQIFQLETRTEAKPRPFDEVRDEILQHIGEERLDGETVKYLQQLRAQAYLDWKNTDLRQVYEKRLAEKATNASTTTPQ